MDLARWCSVFIVTGIKGREWMEWGGILFDARQEALLRLIVVKVMDYLGKLLSRQKETDG